MWFALAAIIAVCEFAAQVAGFPNLPLKTSGRDILDNQEDMGLPLNKWQVGAGILLTVGILGYIGRLAKNALDEAEAEEA